MVGNPGETRETMMETLNFAKSLRMDTAQFFPLMLYPGTEAYDWAKDNNYIKANSYDEWIKPNGVHSTVLETPELTSQEMVEFCNYARRKYYLRPSYMLMKAGECLTDWGDFKRTLKAFMTFRKYLFK